MPLGRQRSAVALANLSQAPAASKVVDADLLVVGGHRLAPNP
jgi:hypothetical protein